MGTTDKPRLFHIGAQSDALFIISGEAPALNNDYPRHDADRTCVAQVYNETEARRLVDAANRGLGQRPAGVRSVTVSTESRDDLPPMACIVRASGEGRTDWKLCHNEAEIRAAYVEMVCGSDDDHHKDEIDGIMAAFRGGEGWRGDTLKIDLYCASFTITRFPAECIDSSASVRRDDVPLTCKVVDGAIQFAIGEKVLAHATNICPRLWDAEKDRGRYRVTDPAVFAEAVAHELNDEREDGSTLLTDALDKAVEEAIEQGAEGVEENAAVGPGGHK
jgi:hypothetical protein